MSIVTFTFWFQREDSKSRQPNGFRTCNWEMAR